MNGLGKFSCLKFTEEQTCDNVSENDAAIWKWVTQHLRRLNVFVSIQISSMNQAEGWKREGGGGVRESKKCVSACWIHFNQILFNARQAHW